MVAGLMVDFDGLMVYGCKFNGLWLQVAWCSTRSWWRCLAWVNWLRVTELSADTFVTKWDFLVDFDFSFSKLYLERFCYNIFPLCSKNKLLAIWQVSNLYCNYFIPINLTPNGIPFHVLSIAKVWLKLARQSRTGLMRFRNRFLCVNVMDG